MKNVGLNFAKTDFNDTFSPFLQHEITLRHAAGVNFKIFYNILNS